KAMHSYNLALWLGAAAAAVTLSQSANAQAPAAPPAAAAAPAAPAAPAGPPPGPIALQPGAAAAALNWSNQRLLNAEREPQNWLMQGHDVEAHRYSALTQINRTNVA